MTRRSHANLSRHSLSLSWPGFAFLLGPLVPDSGEVLRHWFWLLGVSSSGGWCDLALKSLPVISLYLCGSGCARCCVSITPWNVMETLQSLMKTYILRELHFMRFKLLNENGYKLQLYFSFLFIIFIFFTFFFNKYYFILWNTIIKMQLPCL